MSLNVTKPNEKFIINKSMSFLCGAVAGRGRFRADEERHGASEVVVGREEDLKMIL